MNRDIENIRPAAARDTTTLHAYDLEKAPTIVFAEKYDKLILSASCGELRIKVEG